MSRLGPVRPVEAPALSRGATPASTLAPRIALLAALALAVAAVGVLGRGGPPLDADFAALLGFMAITKAGIALGAAVLVWWRLGHPLRGGTAGAVIAASATALAGPVLMLANPEALHLGAVLHYGGLGALAGLAWRDRAAIGALLAQAVARRRAGG